jgi:hypothetical protein
LPLLPFRIVSNLIKRLSYKRPSILVGLEPLLNLSLLMIPLAYRRPEAAKVAGDVLDRIIARIPPPTHFIINLFLASYGSRMLMDVLAGGGEFTKDEEQIIYDDNTRRMLERWQEKSILWYSQREKNDPIRKYCAEAIEYFDPSSGSLDGYLGDLLFKLAQEADRFVYLTIVQVLMARFEDSYQELFDFAKRLYFDGNTHSQYLALRYFTLCTFLVLGRSGCKQEHVDFANQMVWDFLSFPEKVINYNGSDGIINLNAIPHLSHFGFSVLYEMHTREHGELETVKELFDNPWPDNKSRLKMLVITSGLSQAVLFATALTRPKIGLVLETFIQWIRSYEQLSLDEQNLIAGALASYRSVFPHEVDIYLADAPVKLRNIIHTKVKPFSIPALSIVGMQAGVPWMHKYVPEFNLAFKRSLVPFALGEISMDEAIKYLGKDIGSIYTIQAISSALTEAGN